MIIYGSKVAHLKSEQSRRATCESCSTKGSIVFSVFSKHAHIFWIPLFPVGKKGVSECQHCKNVLTMKEMPADFKEEYKKIKSGTKPPVWQFSGLILIVLLVSWGMYSSGEQTKRELSYLAEPQIGDVYEFKTGSSYYSTFKILAVSNDSLHIAYNTYETDRIGDVDKIDKASNYLGEKYAISRQQAQKMYEDKEVYDINRKEP